MPRPAVLVDRPDADTLDPFILRHDKRRLFSGDRRAVLGYRYVRGVGLAAGDPAGDPAASGAVLRRFLTLCERMGWRPALVGARADRLPLYTEQGLHTLYIGDEAIIDVDRFTLTGRPMCNAPAKPSTVPATPASPPSSTARATCPRQRVRHCSTSPPRSAAPPASTGSR